MELEYLRHVSKAILSRIMQANDYHSTAFRHFAKGKGGVVDVSSCIFLYLLVPSCTFLYRVKIGYPNDDSLCLSSLPRLKKCWPR